MVRASAAFQCRRGDIQSLPWANGRAYARDTGEDAWADCTSICRLPVLCVPGMASMLGAGTNEQDRAGCMAQDVLCHAPEDPASEPTSSVRRHGDEACPTFSS